jgi:hypothetical protein
MISGYRANIGKNEKKRSQKEISAAMILSIVGERKTIPENSNADEQSSCSKKEN